METLDLSREIEISRIHLHPLSSSSRDERRGSLDRIDIRRFHHRTFVYLLHLDPAPSENRTVETNDPMKDEKTMKSGQLTRIPFQPTPPIRARESADENRHVSFLAPFSPSRRLLFFPPSRRLFCYFIRIHGKDIRRRPCRRAARNVRQQYNRPPRSTGMIAPFDDDSGCQWRNIRIRSDIHT